MKINIKLINRLTEILLQLVISAMKETNISHKEWRQEAVLKRKPQAQNGTLVLKPMTPSQR